MKFCKDCKHFIAHSVTLDECGLSKETTCPVSGKVSWESCISQRVAPGVTYCGPEARFFEPKEA